MAIFNLHYLTNYCILTLDVTVVGIFLWLLNTILRSPDRIDYYSIMMSLITLTLISSCLSFFSNHSVLSIGRSAAGSDGAASNAEDDVIGCDNILDQHIINSSASMEDYDDKSSMYIKEQQQMQEQANLNFDLINSNLTQQLLPPVPSSSIINESEIHSLNIPQISTSPMIPTNHQFEPTTPKHQMIHNQQSLNSLYHKPSLVSLPQPQQQQDDIYSDISSNNDNDLYSTLNKEISLSHKSSLPNLPHSRTLSNVPPNDDLPFKIVRHSQSLILGHKRRSSSPIKKFSSLLNLSDSTPNNGKEHYLGHKLNHSIGTINFYGQQTNNTHNNDDELNMTLIKTIQNSSPKRKRKKSSLDLRNVKLTDFQQQLNPLSPSWDISDGFVFKDNEFQKTEGDDNTDNQRIVSNNSIPDGYFSAYDREKWQAIKNSKGIN